MRRKIGMGDLDYFEVDDGSDRLYWKGTGVVMERRLTLDHYQKFLASIAAFGALLAGIHPFGASLGWW